MVNLHAIRESWFRIQNLLAVHTVGLVARNFFPISTVWLSAFRIMHPLAEWADGVGVEVFNFEIVDPPCTTVQLDRDHAHECVAGALQQASALDVAVEGCAHPVAGRRLTPR